MTSIVLCCLALVAFQEAGGARPPSAPKGAPTDPPKPDEAAARAVKLGKYEEMRAKSADTAAAHLKLATWCEQNGLTEEAQVHLANVVRLDPTRDAVWRKLGFKKREGRWVTDAQIAQDAAERKVDSAWAEKLKLVHKHIHGGKKQAEVQATLSAINDAGAVSAVYREFGLGGERDQTIAIQVLGQIEGRRASQVLAALAIYGKTQEVRAAASATLRRRPSAEFLDVFANLLKDPVKYDVRPVGGPGSPGVLFVEGERVNVQRVYAPPPARLNPLPGDTIGYDANGNPFLMRDRFLATSSPFKVSGSTRLIEFGPESFTTYTLADAAQDAQAAAQTAQGQLTQDIRAIDQRNADAKAFNELVMAAARSATGKDAGKTPKEWRELAKTLTNRSVERYQQARKPLVSEIVPIDYVASAGFTFVSLTQRPSLGH